VAAATAAALTGGRRSPNRQPIEPQTKAEHDPGNSDMQKQKLIELLNEDLAGELGAIIQYLTYAAKVTGPFRPQLSQFFLAEIADEQRHAGFLANKIVALGGEPVTVPREVAPADTNRAMLEAVLEAERRAVRDYTERARQAEQFGDKGLSVELEDIVRDESNHAEETERILRDWPL
jgi:bacterioferritin